MSEIDYKIDENVDLTDACPFEDIEDSAVYVQHLRKTPGEDNPVDIVFIDSCIVIDYIKGDEDIKKNVLQPRRFTVHEGARRKKMACLFSFPCDLCALE